jgi:3-phosphoshikimate 1-carboxyvinyltransferase
MNPQSNEFWPAPQARSKLAAKIRLPGSKSLTNRELVLSALASGPSRLRDPLRSRDSELMIAALGALGCNFSWQDDDLVVHPAALAGPATIDCGLAGTVMRFLPPIAGLATAAIDFDGDPEARRRPMATTVDSLLRLGVDIDPVDSMPFQIRAAGSIKGGELQIDASASSQFVSGLLLAAPRFELGLTLHHVGDRLPSLPHIEMTLSCLRARGVTVNQIGDSSWRVEPGEIAGADLQIEPDLSNAGPFLAAALVVGGEVSIANWPQSTDQVGADFESILPLMGARIERVGSDLKVSGSGEVVGIDIDLSRGGELAPTIVALAALATTSSRITGIAHLRGHETDRLAALEAEINRAGGRARQLEDGLEIEPAPLHASDWQTYHDHRMATAGAIIGLRVPGVRVENIATTAKTMPGFVTLWQQLLSDQSSDEDAG